MAEYSRLAKGSFVATGTEAAATSAVIKLPFMPDFVEIWNYTNMKNAPAVNKVTRAWWDSNLIDTTSSTIPTMIELYPSGSTTFTAFDTISNDATHQAINVFQAGQLLQYGPAQQIVSATAANPPVFTVTSHGYKVGDTVLLKGLYQTSSTGMAQMAGMMFTIITVGSANTFTVSWDASGSNYTALSGSPVGSTVQKVLYPFLYLPQDNYISLISLGATTQVTTTMDHNFEVGQQIAFRIPQPYGTVQLNSLPNLLIPGSPAYAYVISVASNRTFTCNINSTAYTAFNPNQPLTPTNTIPGLSFPQVVAVGDVNTGGQDISAGSQLYPPPRFPTFSNRVDTINGPAIKGAFVNNTSMGFTIGAGTAVTNTSATLITTGDIIMWHAYLHDYARP
jgi:hypothetical protein